MVTIDQLGPGDAEILRKYFSDLRAEVHDAYRAARLVGSRMYDRRSLANFWRSQSEWFAANLDLVREFDRQLNKSGIIDPDPGPLLRLLEDSLAAANGHYQTFAWKPWERMSPEEFEDLFRLYWKANGEPGLNATDAINVIYEFNERLKELYQKENLPFPFVYDDFRHTIIDRILARLKNQDPRYRRPKFWNERSTDQRTFRSGAVPTETRIDLLASRYGRTRCLDQSFLEVNTTIIFRQPKNGETIGGTLIRIETGTDYLGKFTAALRAYQWLEPVPESFIRAMDDFRDQRFVSIATAHHKQSPQWTMEAYSIILVWSEQDQAFIARVPELAGCTAHGENWAEAIGEAELPIKNWLDTARQLGREIPIAKHWNAERQCDAIAAEGFAMLDSEEAESGSRAWLLNCCDHFGRKEAVNLAVQETMISAIGKEL
jgi:predicted RNase H-like HicB family nuclease